MNRLLVALLAAFDALVAVAVGVAAALAPLTLVWAVGFGGGADWTALWPAAARLWQFGHLVPVTVTLPQQYTVDTGIAADALTFGLSLAPLAFAVFTAVFAARSGARAAGAGAWLTGVGAGTLTVVVLATAFALTSATPVATVAVWQAIVLPVAVYAAGALCGALVRAWRDGDDGPVDALFVRLDRRRHGAALVAAVARGTAVAVTGFVGIGALVAALAIFARGGDIVALFQASQVDALGASVIMLGQLAYLPTLVVWAGAFAAGPGFTLGAGSTVAASGTQLGVLPAIPVLGAVPPETGSGFLLLALLLVAVGFVAGAVARGRLGLHPDAREPVAPRLFALAGIVVVTGAVIALLAVVTSGAFGPDRFDTFGAAPGPLSLAVAVEVGIGAAIGLLATRPAESRARRAPGSAVPPTTAVDDRSSTATEPAAETGADAAAEGTAERPPAP